MSQDEVPVEDIRVQRTVFGRRSGEVAACDQVDNTMLGAMIARRDLGSGWKRWLHPSGVEIEGLPDPWQEEAPAPAAPDEVGGG